MTARTYINREEQPIPRPVLHAAAILVLALLATVGWARWSGMEPIAQPPQMIAETVRSLVLTRRDDGGLTVTDGITGALIADLAPSEVGFAAAAERALAHTRKTHRLDMTLPVRLVRWEGGKFSLIDPATGWRTDLRAFGKTSVGALARLMD